MAHRRRGWRKGDFVAWYDSWFSGNRRCGTLAEAGTHGSWHVNVGQDVCTTVDTSRLRLGMMTPAGFVPLRRHGKER